MVRIQLAIQQTCSVFLSGPQAVGKSELAYGIYTARHRREGTPRNSGQFFPVDCQVLSDELLVAMLEVLASRLQNNVPAKLHMLVLERCEHLTLSGVDALQAWLEKHGNHCTLVATSRARFDELASKGAGWNRLMTRLCELEVMIPRLKERPEDIMPLALNYLALHCRNKERALLRFSSDAQKLLTSFPWPGNLRQLSSAVEEAVDHAVLSAVIHVNHLPVSIRTFPGTAEQLSSSKFEPIKLDEVLLEFEKIILSRALKLSPRNRARAARWLGISRPRLLRRIAQLGLDVEKRNSSQE
jgi:DNA-binding NtrC family response regulator